MVKGECIIINKQKTIDEIVEYIKKIDSQDNQEYKRTLQIYSDPNHYEEYKRLLFNGQIQLFSKLALTHLKHSIQSLIFKEQRRQHKDEEWVNTFFSEDYFHRNAVMFMDSAFNKIATLIKFRYGEPDKYIRANLKRIHKDAKHNDEYINSNTKLLVDQLLGNHSYKLIIESRVLLDHALDPDYTNSKKLSDKLKFDKIIDTVFLIVDEIYNDHITTVHKIADEYMDYYKVKEITEVPEIASEHIDQFLMNSNDYQIKGIKFLHVINNYKDLIYPYIVNHLNIKEKDKDLILSFIPILSDITFRFHEITRSFTYFTSLHYFTEWQDILGREITEYITDTDSIYFMYISTMRVYSIYDKIANFLSLIYPVSRKETYFKSISEWIIDNDKTNIDLTETLKGILASPSYQAIDMLRQQTSHGWDLAVQQKEGTVFSTEYFTLALYHNLENIMQLLHTIHNVYPNIIRSILIANGIETNSFDEISAKVFTEKNEYIQNFKDKM